jgi:hypothetical protein
MISRPTSSSDGFNLDERSQTVRLEPAGPTTVVVAVEGEP